MNYRESVSRATLRSSFAENGRALALVRGLLQEDSGQDLIEYALVAALVSLAAVVAVSGVSTKIRQAFTSVGSNLTSAL